jgi:hypothetical protein
LPQADAALSINRIAPIVLVAATGLLP